MLAFTANTQVNGPLDIVVYDLATASVKDLTPDPSDDLRPRWSPDGTKIAYASSGPDGGLDVYVINADGSGLTRLTSAPGWQHEPAWSPDGTQVSVCGSIAGPVYVPLERLSNSKGQTLGGRTERLARAGSRWCAPMSAIRVRRKAAAGVCQRP